MFVLQFILHVLHIEALSNFLLYLEYVVIILTPLLITVKLFIDKLFSIFVTTTLLSLVVVVTTNLM
jgi:hypothetical protein